MGTVFDTIQRSVLGVLLAIISLMAAMVSRSQFDTSSPLTGALFLLISLASVLAIGYLFFEGLNGNEKK